MQRGKKKDTDYNTIYWRWHDSAREKVRTWRAYWEGDQFEVYSRKDFEVLTQWLKRLGFRVEMMDD